MTILVIVGSLVCVCACVYLYICVDTCMLFSDVINVHVGSWCSAVSVVVVCVEEESPVQNYLHLHI